LSLNIKKTSVISDEVDTYFVSNPALQISKPENLRTSIENNLRTLKIEQVTLVHFRAMGAGLKLGKSV
jgi:hypothetical protein